jgi:type I restriction enzyme M protein
LRGKYRENKYRDYVLPFVVLRRFECALEPTKKAVIKEYENLNDKIDDIFTDITKMPFYNISKFNLNGICSDPQTLEKNLKSYINGFSENIKDILSKYNFDTLIADLEESSRLFQMVKLYSEIDLSPENISNADMGTIFEELLRKFNDQSPDGEHYTSPDVVELLSSILLSGDNTIFEEEGKHINVLDSACGTGRMLFIFKNAIERTLKNSPQIHLYGQESAKETYAISCSDMIIKGEDPKNITFGSTLEFDGTQGIPMDFVIMNPPFGVE